MTASPAGTQRPHWWNDPLEVGRELTVFGLNLAGVCSLGRLFVGTDHYAALLSSAVIAHLFFLLLRRTNRSLGLATALTPVAVAIAAGLVFHPRSTILGVPSPITIELLQRDLREAFALFGEAPTPAPAITGFLLLSAAALWLAAFVADWAAFRLDLAVEAMLPSATMFVFAAVLADDNQRAFVSMVSITAALAFLLVQRVARQARRGHWVAGAAGRGSAALVGTGSLILVAAVFAASLAGPKLPGAGAAPLVELEPSKAGPQARVTVSPLVDIRRRLVEQANVEVFRVTSDVRAYWRLTSLDAFDGRIWSSSGSYGRADGTLADAPRADRVVETSSQTFEVQALAAIWLPAAFEPRTIDSDLDLRYDELSSTLIVDTDVLDSDGITYSVESDLPRFSPDELRSSIAVYPADIVDTALELPADFPPSVRDLAAQITAAANSPYESALLLQDFLRGFRYDLAVPSGHSDRDLERFLFTIQAGYCEQFAGAFAAMARSLDLPSRVAVGFTPGIEVEPGVYSVRGEHAHAWPEVYFEGLGWVPFEPTPGRGAPFSENYTGVTEAQVLTGGDPNTATTLPVATTQPPRSDAPASDDVDTVEPDPVDPAVVADLAADDGGSTGLGLWTVRLAIGLGVVLALAAGYVMVALLIDARRRRRRRLAAETPTDRVRLAWNESLEHLGLLGLVDDPAATHSEATADAARVLPTGSEQVETIGGLAEAAVYGPDTIGDDEVERAELAAGEIAIIVQRSTTIPQRSKRRLHPRTVLGVGPFRRIGGD